MFSASAFRTSPKLLNARTGIAFQPGGRSLNVRPLNTKGSVPSRSLEASAFSARAAAALPANSQWNRFDSAAAA